MHFSLGSSDFDRCAKSISVISTAAKRPLAPLVIDVSYEERMRSDSGTNLRWHGKSWYRIRSDVRITKTVFVGRVAECWYRIQSDVRITKMVSNTPVMGEDCMEEKM